jgi:hypothetical protein
MLPGTELAFAEDVEYDNRWIWKRAINFRVGKFGAIDPDVPHRHHDAIEFPDGSNVLVTQLSEGQRVTVLQLPVVHQAMEHAQSAADTNAAAPVTAGWKCHGTRRRPELAGCLTATSSGSTQDVGRDLSQFLPRP